VTEPPNPVKTRRFRDPLLASGVVRSVGSLIARAATTAGLLCAWGSAANAAPMSISPAQAYDLGQIPSPRPVAMGDALNALGVSTSALYLNPAALPYARVYHLEALAAYGPEDTRQTYGLAIADSLLNAGHVSGGLGGTWSTFDPNGIQRQWVDARLAVALPLGDHFSVGLTGRYMRLGQQRGTGPFGPDALSDGGTNPLLTLITFDAGATASIIDGLRVSVVGHNLTNPGTSLAPTTGAAGVGYTNPLFSIEADGLLDFTTWGTTKGRAMVGGEVFLADRYAIRAGWRYDAGMNVNTGSLGFGYIDPRWSIEGAYKHDLGTDHASSLFVLSFRYFYDAVGNTSPVDQPDSL
jgi:hypothetical protein